MKKIIALMAVMFLMMSFSSLALVRYEGPPSTPYLVFGNVEWNGAPLSLARLKITNENTGFTKDITTDGRGYWQEDSGSWLTIASMRSPIQFGDVIRITAVDGCDSADVCTKVFNAYSGVDDYEYKIAARIDLTLTGELVCPPASCPSCGGSGSCSDGGSGYFANQEYCDENYPSTTTCEDTVCPPKEECPITDCSNPTKELCNILFPPVEPTEPVDGEGSSSIWITILVGILSASGGAGIMFKAANDKMFLGKGCGAKWYRGNDGNLKQVHKHPGTTGYHNPETQHRSPETHPAGMIDCSGHYLKNDDGDWVYHAKKVA